MLAAGFKPFGAGDDLLFYGGRFFIRGIERHDVEAAAGKMPIGTQNAWDFSFNVLWAIEVACDKMAGVTFEIDLFDRVAFAIDRSINDGIQWSLFRQGPQSGGNLDLAANLIRAVLPLVAGSRHGERKVPVQIFERPQSAVGRQLARLQDSAAGRNGDIGGALDRRRRASDARYAGQQYGQSIENSRNKIGRLTARHVARTTAKKSVFTPPSAIILSVCRATVIYYEPRTANRCDLYLWPRRRKASRDRFDKAQAGTYDP